MIVKKRQSGFTLIELAVVLVIMGVLAGSVISTLGARIGNVARAETKKELEQIKQALIGYALVNKRLPCPDNPADTDADGLSDGDGLSEATCNSTADDGSLPWVTLGLGSGDAWGNRYDYFVYNAYSMTDILLGGASGGEATIKTNINGTETDLANNVVAVIYSRGKNSLGAVGTNAAFRSTIPAAEHVDELENADKDKTFFSRPPTADESATDIFDDVVVWISAYELKAKMVEAGVLP